jgi:hypothetical protein
MGRGDWDSERFFDSESSSNPSEGFKGGVLSPLLRYGRRKDFIGGIFL